MKNSKFYSPSKFGKFPYLIAFLTLSLIIQSCNNFDEFSVDLQDPNSLELGTTMVWLNGELSDFNPIGLTKIIGSNFFSVQARKPYTEIVGRTNFNFFKIALAPDTYSLTSNESKAEEESDFVFVSASSGIGVDTDGAEYKYICSDDEIFEITFLDLEKEQAAGRFKAKFKMTRSRGFSQEDIGLPKFVTLEGVFFEEFL